MHNYLYPHHRTKRKQKLISRLDSRTLRPVNVLGLLVFSNNIKTVLAILEILNVE